MLMEKLGLEIVPFDCPSKLICMPTALLSDRRLEFLMFDSDTKKVEFQFDYDHHCWYPWCQLSGQRCVGEDWPFEANAGRVGHHGHQKCRMKV